MTVRERNLLTVLIASAAVVFAVFLFWMWFWEPLQAADRQAQELNGDIDKQQQQINLVYDDQKRLAKYKAFSLPASPDQADSDYMTFLRPLLKKSGLAIDVLAGPAPGTVKMASAQGKKAGHIPLTFNVVAHGDIGSLVRTLENLRAAPVTHRIKSLSLTPADSKDAGKLKIAMTIEALIVAKAGASNPYLSERDNRIAIMETLAALTRGPVGLAQGPWKALKKANENRAANDGAGERSYASIKSRDIFVGGKAFISPKKEIIPTEPPAQEFDVLKYVRLDFTNPVTNEAYLRNLIYRQREELVRPWKVGYKEITIRTEDKSWVLFKAKALRVDQRDLYFQYGAKIYRLHIGFSVYDAMWQWDDKFEKYRSQALTQAEIEALELDELFDEDFAEESEGKSPKKKSTIKTKTPTKMK